MAARYLEEKVQTTYGVPSIVLCRITRLFHFMCKCPFYLLDYTMLFLTRNQCLLLICCTKQVIYFVNSYYNLVLQHVSIPYNVSVNRI
jgi:hypothetical protein